MSLIEILVIVIILVQLVVWIRLRLPAAAVPGRRRQFLRRVVALLAREDVLERLGPLHPVVQSLQTPQFLKEVQEGGVRVRRVVGIHGTLVVDQVVRRDVGRDDE